MKIVMDRRKRTEIKNGVATASIEFAIVLPLLLLVVFGLVDFGRAIWTQATLSYAAQATARCAAIVCASDLALYGQNHAYGLSDVTISTSAPACGQQVIASKNFTYFMPLLASFSGTFSATACFPT